MTNLRHVSKVRRMMAPWYEPDDIEDEPERERPDRDEPAAWFGPDLDYAYDPGAGGDWMAS